ncbi:MULTISPECIES: AAA family ATPase [Nostoc]|uniref:AAA family ATPase n=1 Tax=Nostoc TaxID=1177 RepID=UPI001F54DA92
MKLSNLLSTLDSQIPIAAVDVLSPDEATIIQWLTTEASSKLSSPVFFWNLGVSTLEQCLIAADGGLDLLREWLTRRRRLFTQEARELHLPQPKGVLLAGPPGTGKTLLAKNIANILNLPLLQLDIASLLGSLVGESEGNVRRALKTAEAIAPCVLWVDEIEKALSGTGDTSGVSQRILGNILTFMSESRCGVFVVATCNDPSALPSDTNSQFAIRN